MFYFFFYAKEFNILAVPIIGILDSNATKESYFYGFPGNDDSFEVFQFFFEFDDFRGGGSGYASYALYNSSIFL